MKKTLIILVLLLGLIWLVVLPALVGAYLERAAPGWLEAADMSESATFEAGWFSSRLEVNDDYRLDLSARHTPPLSLAWIRIAGKLQTSLSPAPFALRGEFGLTGQSSVTVHASELSIENSVRLSSGDARLALTKTPDQSVVLNVRLDDLALSDLLGNALSATRSELDLSWKPSGGPDGNQQVRQTEDEDLALVLILELDADSGPLRSVRGTLRADSVQREALADLISGLQQLSGAPAQSTAQQFALLTVAGAWQQLSQNGLSVELEQLQIGAENRLSGHWAAHDGPPVIRGAGSIESLTRALVPVVGLSAGVTTGIAERSIRTWLDELEERGWMVVEEDRWEFRYSGPAD